MAVGEEHVQELANSVLRILAREAPQTSRLMMTLHGVGAGLDEEQVLRTQISGYVAALQDNGAPPAIQRITIISKDVRKVARYRQILDRMASDSAFRLEPLTKGLYRLGLPDDEPAQASEAQAAIAYAGKAADAKPYAFIAMPFGKRHR